MKVIIKNPENFRKEVEAIGLKTHNYIIGKGFAISRTANIAKLKFDVLVAEILFRKSKNVWEIDLYELSLNIKDFDTFMKFVKIVEKYRIK